MILTLVDNDTYYRAVPDLEDHTVVVVVSNNKMVLRVTLSYEHEDIWCPTHCTERLHEDGDWKLYRRKLPRKVDENVYQMGYFFATMMDFK